MRLIKRKIITYMLVCIGMLVLSGIIYGNKMQKLIYTDILFSLKTGYGIDDVENKTICNAEFSNVEKIYEYDGEIYYSADVKHAGKAEKLINKLTKQNMFTYVENDAEMYSDAIPNERTDRYMKDQWYLDYIGAKDAWQQVNDSPGEDVVVAVIDTGVDYTHEDLKNSMWINEREYYGRRGRDDDGNGIADDLYGANIIDKTGDPMDNDESGHGTHVAGIIAMTANNGSGVGIAYDAKIMAVKAGNSQGSFKVSDIISAVEYAMNNGANIINMSFGAYIDSTVFEKVLKKASEKCILVAAAGNDSLPNSESLKKDAVDAYPAAYPFVIGVMAHDDSGKLTNWSNYDAKPYSLIEYEMAAPGYNILSTIPGNKYAIMSGTSMAAPMVSATAAILYSEIVSQNGGQQSIDLNSVLARITRANTKTATTVTGDAKSYVYKSLYIPDILTKEETVDIQLGNVLLTDGTNLIDDVYTIWLPEGQSSVTKEVMCGYVLNNTWAAATDINVEVSSPNESVSMIRNIFEVSAMDVFEKMEIARETNKAFSFTYSGTVNTSQTILLQFKITAKPVNSEEIYTYTFDKNITFNVLEEKPVVTPSPQPAADLNVATATPDVTMKIKKVKGLKAKTVLKAGKKKVTLTWKKVKGAKKYEIYYSKKKSGGYKKLKVTAKTKYTHSFSAGKKYYYKVRAFAKSTGGRVNGAYSKKVKSK